MNYEHGDEYIEIYFCYKCSTIARLNVEIYQNVDWYVEEKLLGEQT